MDTPMEILTQIPLDNVQDMPTQMPTQMTAAIKLQKNNNDLLDDSGIDNDNDKANDTEVLRVNDGENKKAETDIHNNKKVTNKNVETNATKITTVKISKTKNPSNKSVHNEKGWFVRLCIWSKTNILCCLKVKTVEKTAMKQLLTKRM